MERWTRALELSMARMWPAEALRQYIEARTRPTTATRSGSGSVR
jgi:hypothetical protein